MDRSLEAPRHIEVVVVGNLADHILEGGLVAGNSGRSLVGTGYMDLTFLLFESR